MQKLVWQNANGTELDLTSGNYGITEWEGFSNTGLNIQTQTVPFQDGGVFLDALMEQRELSVTLAIQDNNNLTLRYQQRRELISALNPKLGEGYLIYTNDFISKRIKCVPQIPIFETHNSDTAGTPKASLSWVACEPYWEDLEETIITVGNSQTVVENNGDVPCQIKAVLNAGSKNPVLINNTNEKQIALEGYFRNDVFVDTNNGNKKIETDKMMFDWLQGGNIYSCCVGQGKIVFAGEVSFVRDYYKDDSYVIEIDNRSALHAVVYAQNKFVAVGDDGVIASSIDGRKWTTQNSGVSTNLRDIIYSPARNLFIAVGQSGTVLTSSDGVNWTKRNFISGGSSFYIYCITYAFNKFFVGCGGGVIAYSSDGISWEGQTEEGSGAIVNGITFANGKLVAVCSGGKIITSTSGEMNSWTAQTSGINTDLLGVAFNSNTNMIIACGGSGRIITSSDGVSWSSRTSGVSIVLNKPVIISGDIYVMGNAGTLLLSTEGTTWTLKAGGVNVTIYKIAYGNGIYVAVGTSGIILTSTDRKAWTERTSGVSTDLTGVVYNETHGLFVVCGASGVILNSADGITWTRITISGYTTNLRDIAISDNPYNPIMVIVGVTGAYLYGGNGTTWNRSVMSGGYTMESICYGNGHFVAVGSSGMVAISTSGSSWTVQSSGFTNTFYSVCYGNGYFVAVGSSGKVIKSQDNGSTWVEKNSGTTYGLYSIAYGSYYGFIAVGSMGTVVSSEDGESWVVEEDGINMTMRSVAYYESTYLISGAQALMISAFLELNKNVISSLKPSSDMTFNLKQGENEIEYLTDNNLTAVLSFRQKYIGV